MPNWDITFDYLMGSSSFVIFFFAVVIVAGVFIGKLIWLRNRGLW